MGILVWIGALVTVIGVIGLAGCIMAALRARRAGLDEAAMRDRLQRLVAWNMGSLGLSAIGLMLVVIGLTFG